MSDIVEAVARALFLRDVEEDVCDGSWEENEALHGHYREEARTAISAAAPFHAQRADIERETIERCAKVADGRAGILRGKAKAQKSFIGQSYFAQAIEARVISEHIRALLPARSGGKPSGKERT